MLARDAKARLDTENRRQSSLALHADYRNWEVPTPYISFTSSSTALRNLVEKRQSRGSQSIVVVDPRIRIELGLPILHYKDEMEFYGIQPPYGRQDYWTNHYLCLWEVTPEEVVEVWEADDLLGGKDWFEEVVRPIVEQNRLEREHRRNPASVDDASEEDDEPEATPSESGEYEHSGDEETHSDGFWSGSEDSDERVLNENWTGQLVSMYEDLRID